MTGKIIGQFYAWRGLAERTLPSLIILTYSSSFHVSGIYRRRPIYFGLLFVFCLWLSSSSTAICSSTTLKPRERAMTGKIIGQFYATVRFGCLGIPQTGKARQQEIPIDRLGARRIGVFFLGVEKDVFEVPEIGFSALLRSAKTKPLVHTFSWVHLRSWAWRIHGRI